MARCSSSDRHRSAGREALENRGRRAEALAAYERAVELGEKNADPNVGIYRQNRDRVKGE